MSAEQEKSLGKAIDEIINALKSLNDASRLVALKAASDYLGLAPASLSTATPAGMPTAPMPPAASASVHITDIKSLKEAKNPATALEMACVVAFYLQEMAPPSERKTEIATTDIDKYFRQAGYPLPKVQRQLLPDAKNAGYFDSPSKGVYKLNAVGYNLVAHRLPRAAGDAATAGSNARRVTRPKRKQTAAKK